MESKSAEPESEAHPTKAEADRLADLDDVREALPSTSRASAGDASSSDLVASTSQSDGRQPVAQSHPELMRIMQEAIDAGRSGRRHGTRDTTDSHKFWSTQPMPKYEEKIPSNVNEAIEVKSVEEVKQDSYQLPGEYVWDVMDLSQTEVLEELYQLLHDNYVEDDDAMFRFRYSHEFLLWALKPPHWTEQWHIGVRVNNPTRKLVGFISAVPAQIRVRGKSLAMSEVNFLCVHKKLRSKRMAVILIKEITRRCNVINVFQAVYTAGAVLPKPVGTCRYWHRSLNPQKLVDVNFSSVGKNMTIQRMKKLYKLPDEPKTPGFRKTESKDVPAVHQLLNQYLHKFELAPEFTVEEVEHYFVPKDKIVYSYVVDGGKGQITDFSSFYSLPSTVVNNTTHDSIYAAYSYYNVASKTSWEDLMFDTIVMAKKNGFDVFNALDLMDNKQFIPQLKFGIGDGNLNYYVYNWKCSEMDAAQIGLVLM